MPLNIGQQDKIRAQRRRQRRRRLIGVDVHQLSFVGDANRAHDGRWPPANSVLMDKRRRFCLRFTDVAQFFIN